MLSKQMVERVINVDTMLVEHYHTVRMNEKKIKNNYECKYKL